MEKYIPTDGELANVLEMWLDDATRIIRLNIDSMIHIVGMPKWHFMDGGTFQHLNSFPTYNHTLFDELIFDNNAAWRQVEEIAALHQKLNRHCGVLVGSESGSASMFSLRELCGMLIPQPRLMNQQSATVDLPDDITMVVWQFIDDINADTSVNKTIWPIVGITTENPIVLEDGVLFRELSNAEKLDLLNFGLMQSEFYKVIEPENARWYGLCWEALENKQFGSFEHDMDLLAAREVMLDQLLEDFLTVSALATEKTAYHGGGFHGAPRYDSGGLFFRGIIGRGFGANYIKFLFTDPSQLVTEAELQKIAGAWHFLRSKKGGKFRHRVQNASRRLQYADTRLKPEDRLLDLIIAAESLYLDESTHGELTYRMSLNASLWSSGDNAAKQQVFETFKTAYARRSRVVHGSTANPTEIAELVQKLKPTLKSGIIRAIGELQHSEKSPDWLSMILPTGNAEIPEAKNFDA